MFLLRYSRVRPEVVRQEANRALRRKGLPEIPPDDASPLSLLDRTLEAGRPFRPTCHLPTN